jgi:peptide deformylase
LARDIGGASVRRCAAALQSAGRHFEFAESAAMILKIARLGFPSIRTRAQDVAPARIKTRDFQKLIDDMIETMKEYHGVGVAAPQVHLPIRLAVLEVESHSRYPDMPSVPLTVLINPEVTVLDPASLLEWEGCLSVPDLRGLVPRHSKVRVRALGRDAEPLDFVAEGFHARVIQHETDHLKGEVYLDRMPDLRNLGFIDEWQRFLLPQWEKGSAGG